MEGDYQDLIKIISLCLLEGTKYSWYTGSGLPSCCPLEHEVMLHDQVPTYVMCL